MFAITISIYNYFYKLLKYGYPLESDGGYLF